MKRLPHGTINPVQPKRAHGTIAVAIVLGVLSSMILSVAIYIFSPPSSRRNVRVRMGERDLVRATERLAEKQQAKPDTRQLDRSEAEYLPWWGDRQGSMGYAIVPVLGRPDADTFEFYAVSDYLNYPTLYLRYDLSRGITEQKQIGPFADKEHK